MLKIVSKYVFLSDTSGLAALTPGMLWMSHNTFHCNAQRHDFHSVSSRKKTVLQMLSEWKLFYSFMEVHDYRCEHTLFQHNTRSRSVSRHNRFAVRVMRKMLNPNRWILGGKVTISSQGANLSTFITANVVLNITVLTSHDVIKSQEMWNKCVEDVLWLSVPEGCD